MQSPIDSTAMTQQAEALGWRSVPAMRYPNEYVWMIIASTLDITFTWIILMWMNGTELNPIADLVIESWGLPGAIGFKFSLMLFVIIICEVVGRKRDLVGRGLALVAALVSAFPVVWSTMLLIIHRLG